MSTRSLIVVRDEHDALMVYRHCDGYPDGEHGVIATLRQALPYSWGGESGGRRFEASDFSASIVAAWKEGAGNVYFYGDYRKSKVPGDIAYLYEISEGDAGDPVTGLGYFPKVKVSRRAGRSWKNPRFEEIWSGRIGDEFPLVRDDDGNWVARQEKPNFSMAHEFDGRLESNFTEADASAWKAASDRLLALGEGPPRA